MRKIVIIALTVVALMLVHWVVVTGMRHRENTRQLQAAMELAEKAKRISRESLTDSRVAEMRRLIADALDEARKVDISLLDARYPAFRHHFENEFLPSMELFSEGLVTEDVMTMNEAMRLDRLWVTWVRSQIDKQ